MKNETKQDLLQNLFKSCLSEQQMGEKRPNGCGAIARNRNPLMICAKNTTNNNNNDINNNNNNDTQNNNNNNYNHNTNSNNNNNNDHNSDNDNKEAKWTKAIASLTHHLFSGKEQK